MANNNTISSLMVRHHIAISLLLKTLEESFRQKSETAEELLGEFRWELEKHIFVEEKAIFGFCGNTLSGKICETMMSLRAEHEIMLNMLDAVKIGMKAEKDTIDILDFQSLLLRHVKTEEESLYPELDNVFNPKQKEKIINRINEISQ